MIIGPWRNLFILYKTIPITCCKLSILNVEDICLILKIFAALLLNIFIWVLQANENLNMSYATHFAGSCQNKH